MAGSQQSRKRVAHRYRPASHAAALGIDGEGTKHHPLGVIEGATENAATVQALLDNLIGRGLDPSVCRLFIVDGAKALCHAVFKSASRN